MQFFKWKKKDKAISENRKGYNEVAYVRHGNKTVYSMGDGGSIITRKQPTVIVTTKSGDKYEMPVDPKTGKVPDTALWGRFMDENSGTRFDKRRGVNTRRNVYIDVGIDADIIHEPPEGGYTPQQLIETGWWQHPNESDIKGIDDASGILYAGEIPEAAKSAKHFGKKIAMGMPYDRAMEVRSVLGRNFTGAELKRAVEDGGIIITEGSPGRGNSGVYQGRQKYVNTPMIVLRPGADEDTITHEFIHHLRQVDDTRGGIARTPFPLTEDKYLDNSFFSSKESRSASNLEEAATVFEAAGRTRVPTKAITGYYAHANVPGRSVTERYAHDRALEVGPANAEKPLRGKRATKAVETKFDNADISRLRYKNGSSARSYLETRRERGDLPVPVPRKKKTEVGTGPSAPIGAEPPIATASRNLMPYRGRK